MIVLFLAVQLAIPISRFGHESARRFGWQMFSSAAPAPQFVVMTANDEIDMDLGDYMARVRADIDVASRLPSHLCEIVPDAQLVTWDDSRFEC